MADWHCITQCSVRSVAQGRAQGRALPRLRLNLVDDPSFVNPIGLTFKFLFALVRLSQSFPKRSRHDFSLCVFDLIWSDELSIDESPVTPIRIDRTQVSGRMELDDNQGRVRCIAVPFPPSSRRDVDLAEIRNGLGRYPVQERNAPFGAKCSHPIFPLPSKAGYHRFLGSLDAYNVYPGNCFVRVFSNLHGCLQTLSRSLLVEQFPPALAREHPALVAPQHSSGRGFSIRRFTHPRPGRLSARRQYVTDVSRGGPSFGVAA